MFKLLRSKAKFFYWIIAASFILFIFLAWGADIQGRRTNPTGPGEVGSVNGRPIGTAEWSQALQEYLGRLRQQDPTQTLTAGQRAAVAEQVWQSLVRQQLALAEIERLGLAVTDEEILDVLRNNPPPELLAGYRRQDGTPDLQAYYADLANPEHEVFWARIEDNLREQLPFQKLHQMIAAQASVSESELHEAYVRRHGKAIVEFMGVAFSDVPAPAEPAESELDAWYQAHRGQFEQPERARVRFVSWAKTPSESDRAATRQLALDIKREIESGATAFAEAAAIYSADGSRDRGGDLGTFDRNQMPAPFTAAAFALPVGQVSDPVETPAGYHLIEVQEQIREGDAVAQLRARHILFEVEPSEGTLAELYGQAEGFVAAAEQGGFDAAAAQAGLPIQTPAPFTAGREIPGLADSQVGARFAFRAKPNQLSSVLENDDAYFVVQMTALIPAGPAPLAEARGQVAAQVRLEKQRQAARQRLDTAVASVRGGASFADAAARAGLTAAVSDTITASSNVPGVGFGETFNLAALEAPVGKLLPAIETARGVFALRPLWKSPLSDADFQAQRMAIYQQALQRKQYERIEAWYEERLAAAKIVDARESAGRDAGS